MGQFALSPFPSFFSSLLVKCLQMMLTEISAIKAD